MMREGWKEVEIKSFAEIVGGGTPSTKNEEYWNGDIPWITPNDLSNHTFKYIERGERNITDLGLSKSSAKLHPINTLLLTSRAPIGYLALAKNEVSTNQGFQSIRCDEKKADAHYVYYALQVYMDRVKALASGATFPEVSGKKVGKVKLPLPPLETQKKIASILSGYDDLIENNLKRIKILEEMAQQTYEEWFVRMRFPGHESTIINKETGLPDGWEKMKLGDLCEKIFDGTHDSPKPKESGYKLITGKHLQKGKVDFESAYYISEEDHLKIKKRSGLEKGDIMFSNIGTIGNLSMVTEDFEYSCKNMIVFRPQKDFQYYLYTYLFNENNKNKMISEAAGSTQKFLSLGYIRGFEDLLPSIRLIKHFNEFAENLYITINNLQNQNQRLREARDILLPRLMMGMVEV